MEKMRKSSEMDLSMWPEVAVWLRKEGRKEGMAHCSFYLPPPLLLLPVRHSDFT